MGLDMYLYKKTFIWSNDKGDLKITHPKYKFNPEKVKYVIEEAGYWRKANAIHAWFVKNVQNGEDDCKEYYVSKSKMEELLGLVNKVLKASELIDGEIQNGSQSNEKGEMVPNMIKGKYIKDPTVAKELLPVQEGFFFGSTDYNEYYIEDLKHTKDILVKALLDDDSGEFEYSSSW